VRLSSLALCSLLTACGGEFGSSSDAGVPTPTDAGPDDAAAPDAAPADVPGDGVWTIVLRRIDIPELTDPTGSSDEVPGMNLDGFVTATERDPIGCAWVDWRAPARFVEVDGIDNQIPRVVDQIRELNPELDLDRDIQNAIADGDVLLVLRVERIGHPTDDGEVDVAVFTTELVDAPVFETVTVDGQPRMLLAPGQTYRALPDSLIDGRPRTFIRNASLRGGRLFTPPGTSFSLRIPARDGRLAVLELQDLRLGGEIGEAGLTNAVIAGYVRVDDVGTTVDSLELEDPPDPAYVDGIASFYADLDADGDPANCEGISLGFEVEGVSAELELPGGS